MVSTKSILMVLATMTMAQAYTNNCEGSFFTPKRSDCDAGISTIDEAGTYTDQDQFSFGNCYIKYATNGAGAQPVSGKVIKDTANAIINNCHDLHGSFGTNVGDCTACHVTVNYRSSKKLGI